MYSTSFREKEPEDVMRLIDVMRKGLLPFEMAYFKVRIVLA